MLGLVVTDVAVRVCIRGGPLGLFTSERLGRGVSAGLNRALEPRSAPVMIDDVIAMYRAYRDFWRALERRRPWLADLSWGAAVMLGGATGAVLWGYNCCGGITAVGV
jgi:hypothetical protein